MALSQNDIRAQVTSRVIACLEKGVRPWVKPWSNDPNVGSPTSFATKKKYQGINHVLLSIFGWDLTREENTPGKWWGTFQQWKQHGASVKAGEKATWIILFKPIEKKTKDDNGDEKIDKFPIMRMFSVFSIDQVIGDEVDKYRPDHKATNDAGVSFVEADRLIKSAGVEIKHGGNVASYSTQKVKIRMPYKSKFNSEENYYSTILHEMSHWANHQIGSKMGARFGDDDYSFGELVAEMSACFLCEACNIPTGIRFDDSVSYLDGWIKKMNADHSYIMKASARASQVSDYVLNAAGIVVPS